MNRIVDKSACVMCLDEIKDSHLAIFYALGLRRVDLLVCVDHESSIRVAVADVNRRFTGPPSVPWWRRLLGDVR